MSAISAKRSQRQRAARGVFSHALAAVAFDPALDGVEQIGPYRLRAQIAAPDAAAEGVHQEQRDRGEDQQAGEVVDLLRPQLDEEEIEAADWEDRSGRPGSGAPRPRFQRTNGSR